MPTPRHRLQAVRRRRRVQRALALAAVVACTSLLAVARGGDGDDAALRTSATPRDSVEGATATTIAVPTTSATTATTTPTTAAPATPTTAAAEPVGAWYAVVLSVRKDASDPEALQQELDELVARGRVVDTDDVRTGDGRAPEYLPAPGLLLGVVGPYGSREQVESWCASFDGDRGCQARQLIAR